MKAIQKRRVAIIPYTNRAWIIDNNRLFVTKNTSSVLSQLRKRLYASWNRLIAIIIIAVLFLRRLKYTNWSAVNCSRSWLANAPFRPVVVNRTLAPLSNLFYAYPAIQSHLRRTINHYLTRGKYPTLAELSR